MAGIEHQTRLGVLEAIEQPVDFPHAVKPEIARPPEIFEQDPAIIRCITDNLVDHIGRQIDHLLPTPWRIPVENVVELVMNRMKNHIRAVETPCKLQLFTVTGNDRLPAGPTIVHLDVPLVVEHRQELPPVVVPYLFEHHEKTQVNATDDLSGD